MASAGAARSGLPRRSSASIVIAALLLTGCTAPAPAPEPVAPAVARPTPPPVDPIKQYADDRLSVMTLEQKILSMFMVHVPGTDAAALDSYASSTGVGGLILMGNNVPEPESDLAAITPAIRGEKGLPILIGIDQEGGVVRRLFIDEAPAAEDLRELPPEDATAAFASRAALLAELGVTVNFGIVADVTGDPASFIYDRSFGATPEDAAARVGAAVAGERGTVLSTLKHFPGHGVAPGDSHSSIPTTAMSIDEWRAGHEEPFRAGIEAGAEFVMVGHLQFDAVDPEPATLSASWHQLLRDELGFEGIVITDDMVMLQNSGRDDLADPAANAVRAVAAGNTMLLYVGGVDLPLVVGAIHQAVIDGVIDESVIDDAAHRLLMLRRTLSGETTRFSHCFEECQSMIE